MKLLLSFCFAVLLVVSKSEPLSQGSTSDKFAQRILHFYSSALAAIRDNYAEDPLNGVTYGSMDTTGSQEFKDYTVTWYNMTIWMTDVNSQSYRLLYHCASEDKLKMTVNRHKKAKLSVSSQIKIQPVQGSIVEGSTTDTWPAELIYDYELNTNKSDVTYISGAASSNSSVDTQMKVILAKATFAADYFRKLESFILNTSVNDGKQKAEGKIFADFSKTTCNELSNENNFRKILINDIQQPVENPAKITVRSIVMESAHNFTAVNFDLFFQQKNGYFAVTFDRMKIKCEYSLPDQQTENYEYFLPSFQTFVKIDQQNFLLGEIKDVIVDFSKDGNEQVSTAEDLIRQHVQKIIKQVFSKAIFSQFSSA